MGRSPIRYFAAAFGLSVSGPLFAGHFPMYASWDPPREPGTALVLTYSFSNLLDGSLRDAAGQSLPVPLLRDAFERALADYAAVVPIHFVEMADEGPLPETGEYAPGGLADIRVGQVDSMEGANAYAYFPFSRASGLAGDIVFNASRFGLGWSPLWFYAVAQHELGHSLGMGHWVSGDADADALLAEAAYEGPLFPLDAGSVRALQSIYGAGVGSVTPLSAVPEPASVWLWLCGVVVPFARRWRPMRFGGPGAGIRCCSVCASMVAMAVSPDAHALIIEFDYSYDTRGFFTDLATGEPIVDRRRVLEQAASYYEGFTDTLSAIAPGDGDQWTVSFMHPGLAGPAVTLVNPVIAADTVRIYVGASASAPGVLGFAGTAVTDSVTGSDTFVEAVNTRGQTTGTDYSVWGGFIWFNAAQDWYFGADEAGLTAARPDFLTTATHEIGHILGFGVADSWLAQIDPVSGLFIGEHAVRTYGSGVALDRHGSHWAEGTMSTRGGVAQETMMDPSTPYGERQLPTALDYAGFADIGWQVSVVSEPARGSMLMSGLVIFLMATLRPARRTAGTARRYGGNRFEAQISGGRRHGDRFALPAHS